MDTGFLFYFDWETAALDDRVQCMLISAAISPIRRIRRIGNRLHAIVGSEVCTWDVTPWEGETIEQMIQRSGRARRAPMMFPCDVDRWGPLQAVIERDYCVRLIIGENVRVLKSTAEHQAEVASQILAASVAHQHIKVKPDLGTVLYGDGTLRVFWPGTVKMNRPPPEVAAEAEAYQMAMDASFAEAEAAAAAAASFDASKGKEEEVPVSEDQDEETDDTKKE